MGRGASGSSSELIVSGNIMKHFLDFEFEGKIQPKQRPRFARRNRIYTPKETLECEKQILLIAQEELEFIPEDSSPLGLSIEIVRPCLKSFSKAKTKLAMSGEIRPTTTPDLDNQIKTISDALNPLFDDSRIVELRASKKYGEIHLCKIKMWEIQ
jgi:Holliday junction resolvase RusA-like endonuclease